MHHSHTQAAFRNVGEDTQRRDAFFTLQSQTAVRETRYVASVCNTVVISLCLKRLL